MDGSLVAALVPGVPASDEVADAVGRLEAELDRQIALREAADRRLARFRDDHEDAYERLLLRCRSLEDEKVNRVEAMSSEVERDRAAASVLQAEHDTLVAERDRLIAERDQWVAEQTRLAAEQARLIAEHDGEVGERNAALAAAKDRESESARKLAEAEARFRAEAFRSSALIALRSKEAQAAQAEGEALRQQLASVFESTSWKIGRPVRGTGRMVLRLRTIPSRLVRALRHQP